MRFLQETLWAWPLPLEQPLPPGVGSLAEGRERPPRPFALADGKGDEDGTLLLLPAAAPDAAAAAAAPVVTVEVVVVIRGLKGVTLRAVSATAFQRSLKGTLLTALNDFTPTFGIATRCALEEW